MKRERTQNLFGNEVYYTACSLLVILNNSCSELHCQKVFDLTLFSCKIFPGKKRARPDRSSDSVRLGDIRHAARMSDICVAAELSDSCC